ncbi:hypothetical protein [Sedimenticola sp.]|uniref:hypothetical protein n=1 Tax=Sedimenticola sp. TaxID=1940285 RepID=UPI003D0E4607
MVRAALPIMLACLMTTLPDDALAQDASATQYADRLDEWVAKGGDPAKSAEVKKNCEELALEMAPSNERMQLKTSLRREYVFRVDTCVKMTMNRAHPKPRFVEREEIMDLCKETEVPLFPLLCRRSGLIK